MGQIGKSEISRPILSIVSTLTIKLVGHTSAIIDAFEIDPESRNKGNDQEPIQSNFTSCPKHQTGKGHLQSR